MWNHVHILTTSSGTSYNYYRIGCRDCLYYSCTNCGRHGTVHNCKYGEGMIDMTLLSACIEYSGESNVETPSNT